MSGIILNEDNSHFFGGRSAEDMTPAGLRTLVENYSGKDVRQIVFCPNCMKTSYGSKVWDNIWDAADGSEAPWSTRWIANAKLLAERGINPFVEWIRLCRERNISPWISMRMNDVHSVDQPGGFIHSEFWKKHPEFRRVSPDRPFSGCWADRALDFAHAEVRERAMLLVREYFELYDMDGLELDWMRFGYHFRPGYEQQGQELLNEFHERVKALAEEFSQRRGHEIKIGVRVPSRIEAAVAMGLDAIEWARRGLVDLVVPTAFFPTTDFDMPIQTWRRLLGDDVQLAAGIEIRTQAFRHAGYFIVSPPEVVFAHAANYLWQGADAIYLFNYMDSETGIDESREEYRSILDNAGTLEKALQLPRRHVVTYADTFAPGQEMTACLLPACCNAERKSNSFRLPLGKLRADATAWVVLGFDANDDIAELNVHVNGTLCAAESLTEALELSESSRVSADSSGPLNRGYNVIDTLKLPKEIVQIRSYRIPAGALHNGYNVIEAEITREAAAKGADAKICWVEVFMK